MSSTNEYLPVRDSLVNNIKYQECRTERFFLRKRKCEKEDLDVKNKGQ